MKTLDQVLRDELAPDEQVLWSDQARQGIVLGPIDALCIPMGCVWCAAAALAVVLSLSERNWLLALGAAAFSLPGLYLAVGRAWIEAAMRRHTTYALTDKRLIFRRPLPRFLGPQIRSLSLSNVTTVTLRRHRQGTGGTIAFRAAPHEAEWRAGSSMPGNDDYALPRLELADSADQVYHLVLQAHGAVDRELSLSKLAASSLARPGLSLRQRQAIVAAFIAFALVANLRWEQWKCLDASGAVVARTGGLLWSWQDLDPLITPLTGTRILQVTVRVVPPVVQRKEQFLPRPVRRPAETVAQPASSS